jgi:prevent-host-death family protein
MATRIVTVSELKTRLGALMAELEKKGVPLYVTQHGKPKAVLARYDEYEALLKKLEDFEDILAMKESLAAPEKEAISLDDYERGRTGRVRGQAEK